MSKAQVQIEVEKEAYDVMQGIAKFVAAVKAAHAGGANLAMAIPADVAAAVADLAPIVGEVGALKGNMEESKAAFSKAILIGAADIAAVFVG
jgi:hypothetical protein